LTEASEGRSLQSVLLIAEIARFLTAANNARHALRVRPSIV